MIPGAVHYFVAVCGCGFYHHITVPAILFPHHANRIADVYLSYLHNIINEGLAHQVGLDILKQRSCCGYEFVESIHACTLYENRCVKN